MKKLKVISFIMAVCLLFLFAGCTGNSGTAQNNASGGITGNWYNESGRCLEIREDGTYKLEDDYGLGHWKTLSDGSYEFSDFYGDLQGFETGTDGTGEYVRLNSEYFYRSSESDGAVQPENTDLQVTKAYDFSEGCAWVEFTRDGVECYGLIDTQGKIIYEDLYSNDKYYTFHPMSGSMCYMTRSDGSTPEYILLNSKGEVIASSSDGEFDEILAEGDGLAFVYKDNSGVNNTGFLYGVLDKNGNWVQPLTDFVYKLDGYTVYAGDGIFIDQWGGIKKSYVFYNSSDNSLINMAYLKENDSSYDGRYRQYLRNQQTYFTNNYAYFQPNDNEFYPTEFQYANEVDLSKLDNVQIKSIKSCFAVNTDGTYTEIPDFIMESEGKLLRKNGDHCEIYDYVNDKSATLSNYNANMINSIFFNGDYGLLCIKGADGNQYFTLIDTNGTEKFEPIQCYDFFDVSYSDNKIISSTEDNVFSIYDENGTVLAEGLNYKQIDGFSDGIAVAVDEDKNTCYINSKGEKILTYLSE